MPIFNLCRGPMACRTAVEKELPKLPTPSSLHLQALQRIDLLRDMGAIEVEAFLTMPANDRKVSPSTHNQALSALLFIYREILADPSPSRGAGSGRRSWLIPPSVLPPARAPHPGHSAKVSALAHGSCTDVPPARK